jgi:hypothetical protein
MAWIMILFPLIIFTKLTQLNSFWLIYSLSPIFALVILGAFYHKYVNARHESALMSFSAALFLFSCVCAIVGYTFAINVNPEIATQGLALLLISSYLIFISLVLTLITYSGLPKVDIIAHKYTNQKNQE